jgi:hypothetical protein
VALIGPALSAGAEARHNPSGVRGVALRDLSLADYDRPVTTDECIALSDDELVDRAYAVVADLAESEDERTAQAGGSLIFLLGEMLERFAPEVAQAELVRNMTTSELGPLDGEDEGELLDALESLRRRQAARLLRDTLSG